MKKCLYIIVMLLFSIFSQAAFAFTCSYGSGSSQEMSGGTIYADIPAISLTKSVTDTILVDLNANTVCNGAADSTWQDALKSTSLTISSSLTALGFSGYLQSGTNKSSSPPDVCLWPDNNCSVNGTNSAPINAKIGLQRVANSGNWAAGTRIYAGTEIARMVTASRSGGGYSNWNYGGAIWIFRLTNDMVIPAYTCSVNQFDSSIKLPDVTRNDLVAAGTGRYSNANKAFKFNLNCDEGTTVSVTFDGDTMTGQDSVLVNKESGNPNVGIQVLFNNSTVVKMNEKLKIADSAVSQEVYTFNAYYFYNGGTVVGGPIRSVATFTFDYN